MMGTEGAEACQWGFENAMLAEQLWQIFSEHSSLALGVKRKSIHPRLWGWGNLLFIRGVLCAAQCSQPGC